jgi:hypothetical protein
MSFKNFFQHFVQGWVPEEPRMPKSSFSSFCTPVVTFIAATTLLSLFSSVFVFVNVAFLSPLPPMVIESSPNSTYLELGGVSRYNNTYLLFLTNGTRIQSKNLTLSLLITQKSSEKCTVNVALECGTFSNQATVDGKIVDGNLVIGSTPSLFLINPDLTENQEVLTGTPDCNLNVTVQRLNSQVSTAADRYLVKSISVCNMHAQTGFGSKSPVFLGYSQNSGALVYSGGILRDVILRNLGIDGICGESLRVIAYSENLGLEVAHISSISNFFNFGFVLFLAAVSTVVVVSIRFVVGLVRKKREQNLLELNP